MISRQFFLNELFPVFKKNRSGQFRTQDFWLPKRKRYLQTKCAGDAQKIEFDMNQDTK